MKNRVAVTGIGVVSPLGHTAAELFGAARAGRSAIHLLSTPFVKRLATPLAATVKFAGGEHFEPAKLRMLDRVSQFAIVAARRACGDSAYEFSEASRERAGVFVGTGMGGTESNDVGYSTLYGENSDRIKPFTVLMGMHNAPAAWIAMEHQMHGPNLTFSTACSSSAVAIGEAWLRVSSGELLFAIAGGAEAPLSFGSLKAWEALHTVAKIDHIDASASCKPFAKNRSGMVLGEGAAMVTLEPWQGAVERGAFIHGELVGYGLYTDATHITQPSAVGQAKAMQAALRAANMEPATVDAINAHGTGTLANDSAETNAIKAVFGARACQIPISATKAMHGHLLGAAGALEFVLSLLSMQHSVALPTMNLVEPDPECDLDFVPNAAREATSIRTMLSNSFAFGGTNAVLAMRGCR